MSIINHFLELKSAGDILNSVWPVKNIEKEISESMQIFHFIRKYFFKRKEEILKNPELKNYTVFDICAGNCLTSSIISHMLKPRKVFAIDIENRERSNLNKINNFEFLKLDILKDSASLRLLINSWEPSILVSVHPCDELAKKIIETYILTTSSVLIMMPCCEGKEEIKYPTFIQNKLSRYERWCLDLSLKCNGNAIVRDSCMSNKNIVIKAEK